MTDIFIYKINIKKSEIPKTLKLPKHVYPQFPQNKKPNTCFPDEEIKKLDELLKNK